MEHLAIMKRGYIEKILSGEKSIESRFSLHRIAPYGKIRAGETVYLQETGKPVTAAFKVADALFFDDLDKAAISEIREKYGERICADNDFWQSKRNARYATLIFVADPIAIEPFKVRKADRSAFKSVGSIRELL